MVVFFLFVFFPTRQDGVVRFYVRIHVCDASTPRPHPVSRQSSSPADPAKYEQLASGSRRVSRQSCSPVDPAQYPARAARQSIPPSIPPVRLASGSRQYPARAARVQKRLMVEGGDCSKRSTLWSFPESIAKGSSVQSLGQVT